jgi:hypothetical protein
LPGKRKRDKGNGRERVCVEGERREREGRRNNGRGMANINKWKESIKKKKVIRTKKREGRRQLSLTRIFVMKSAL